MGMVLLGDWFGFVLIREQFSWGKFYWLCKHELYNSLTYFLSPNLWWIVLIHICNAGIFTEMDKSLNNVLQK